tara:strand:- start:2061 stop:2345 length:285 start_codon:yes stop_codon:yes gene_type:complete
VKFVWAIGRRENSGVHTEFLAIFIDMTAVELQTATQGVKRLGEIPGLQAIVIAPREDGAADRTKTATAPTVVTHMPRAYRMKITVVIGHGSESY